MTQYTIYSFSEQKNHTEITEKDNNQHRGSLYTVALEKINVVISNQLCVFFSLG